MWLIQTTFYNSPMTKMPSGTNVAHILLPKWYFPCNIKLNEMGLKHKKACCAKFEPWSAYLVELNKISNTSISNFSWILLQSTHDSHTGRYRVIYACGRWINWADITGLRVHWGLSHKQYSLLSDWSSCSGVKSLCFVSTSLSLSLIKRTDVSETVWDCVRLCVLSSLLGGPVSITLSCPWASLSLSLYIL